MCNQSKWKPNQPESTASSLSLNERSSSFTTRRNRIQAVWAGRIMFVVSLMGVAGVLGAAANYFLTGSETELADTQFESIAERALNEAAKIASQRRKAALTMASVASQMNPDPNKWPFVFVPGFETIVQNLLNASSGKDMGFAPIVSKEEQSAFEKFAYNYYENTRLPEPFPNGTAVNSFGKGIWAINTSLGTSDNRYHDTQAVTPYNSPNRILTPVFHTDEGVSHLLMFNVHFTKDRGEAIDDMIECSRQRAESGENIPDYICGVITPMINIVKHRKPGAAVFQPIYPAYNLSQMVGFIPTVLLFDDVLENIFANEVSGVDCVLETETQALTYTVKGGVAYLLGEGDLHMTSYDHLRHSVMLTSDEFYTEKSPKYKLSLYPNDELYHVYSTRNPMVATIGAVFIILVTSLLFFVYDSLVRKEFNAKKELLHAKRQFMRFVSHEVRTPLNSVCMGLALIQSEIRASLGDESAHFLDYREEQTPLVADGENDRNALEWFQLAQEIHNSAQDAVDVLNDLLNYDKIEQGKLHLEVTVVSIWKLVERAVSEFKLPAAKNQIQFDVFFHVSEGQLTDAATDSRRFSGRVGKLKLIGDAVRVSQVLRNLISNALKFTPEEGSVSVVVKWIKGGGEDSTQSGKSELTQISLKNNAVVEARQMGYLQVDVVDSGAGMSKAQLAKLFNDGVQFNVNELQAGQGSGLGLFIAKGIVEQHKGTLAATSEGLGKGTTFTLTLPLWCVSDSTDQVRDNKVPQEDETLSQTMEISPLRILVVDDSISNRKLLSRLLKNAGHLCDQAENGLMAVEMVEKAMKDNDPYDSVLMDYEMPEMNGPTAASEIRKVGSDVFIIGVTGNMLPEDIALYRSCGANAVLPKPFKVADVDTLWMEYGIYGRPRGS